MKKEERIKPKTSMKQSKRKCNEISLDVVRIELEDEDDKVSAHEIKLAKILLDKPAPLVSA